MPYTFGSLRREWMGARLLAEQAFSRAAGAPLLSGNSVTLLRDATQNYPRWLEAIGAARERICFENYIIQPDAVGQQFAAALAEKARSGVRVRVIYDWLGSLSLGSRAFWRRLTEAGVEVRCFNPPRLDSPLGWVSREHRKSIAIDGRIGFVSGICISRRWLGAGGEPWRDTGLEIRGPAVADIERAFAEVWALLGPPIPAAELSRRDGAEQNAGGVDLRVVATAPSSAGLFRLDQLIAALARKRLWLADAYFVGASTYVQALCAAAADGVDVRLLVPGTSDVPLLTPLSRAGYRPLLEAGIRVFEWNGPMMHAKTAVADGRWARVGSSNLNIASWIGNYELDVTVENEAFAREMERMYLEDLERSTEVVLQQRRPRRALSAVPPRARHARVRWRGRRGSASRMTAGAIRIANTVGAAITNRRELGAAEAKLMAGSGFVLLLLALLGLLWPRLIAVPLAGFGLWLALALLLQAWRLRHPAVAVTQSGEKRDRETI